MVSNLTLCNRQPFIVRGDASATAFGAEVTVWLVNIVR